MIRVTEKNEIENDCDHLVIDTIDCLPQTGERDVYLKRLLEGRLIEHKQRFDKHGRYLPEIRN